MKHTSYFIHGYSVGSDHSPVQMEIYMGEEGTRKSTFKWNISHLKGETIAALKDRWSKPSRGKLILSQITECD